jgi:hypothetical protein
MIAKDMLQLKTGYASFLQFKRNCQRPADSLRFTGLTKYFYDKDKSVEFDIRPEELFIEADAESVKKKKREKTSPKKRVVRH